ncbi:MAG: hypothetical protein J3K34DRAFT_526039 [Monoraphidium minutum]|nr:MAG: hypothetical protein J3K34DRAFT_526039 [Monoraphidium minutum]
MAPTTAQQPELLALTQWALAAKVKFVPGLRPERLPSGGRGMVSTFPISAGAALVSVPAALALTSAAPPPPALPPGLWAELPWAGRLAALLLLEKAAGASSRSAPFVAALPATAAAAGLPAAWADGEAAQLQVPAVVEQVERQRQEWAALHGRLAPHLPPAAASWDDFLWAMSCVRSRSFGAPGLPLPLGRVAAAAAAGQAAVAAAAAAGGAAAAAGAEAAVAAAGAAAAAWALGRARDPAREARVLCPLIDVFNHSSRTGSGCELDTWSGEFKVVTREAAAAGEEVFINYGAGGNDLLLTLYGFVEEGNPSDTYPLQGLPAKAAVGGRQLREAAAAAAALQEASADRDGLPPAAAAALAAAAGEPAPAAASGGGGGQPVPYAALGPEARAALRAAVEAELKLLGTPLEVDEQLLAVFERTAGADAELAPLRGAAEERGARAAALEGQVEAAAAQHERAAAAAAAEGQAGEGSEGPAAAAAAAAAAEAAALAQALADARAGAAAARGLLERAESEVAAAEAATAGVRRLAVQYRALKKRLLRAVLAQL